MIDLQAEPRYEVSVDVEVVLPSELADDNVNTYPAVTEAIVILGYN